ncbi:hypothetical protein KCU77_g8942, partial [Aureobasidium melanogenum]
MSENQVDVFICGGGPVGLLLSYQLARLGLSTYTVEQFDKTQQAMYGRASTLYPRSIELLDQLDLADAMSQVGFVDRGSVTFKNGRRVHGRGWDFISRMHDTFFGYCLNIRQKYSEDIFRNAYERCGGKLHTGAKLIDFTVDDNAADDYKVKIQFVNENGTPRELCAKYIIGADGGRSSVRRIAQIPFNEERTEHHWVRIDAVIKTDMPDARVGFAAIESPKHGNILVVALDHGRTRIGYALTGELYQKYGDKITEEDVKSEAKKAFEPFSLEFVEVDWWTLYSIGQRIADTFQAKERVLLAGDSAHTHSSGAAQGMNTGVQDAVNLGWKLAGQLKGWYHPPVLSTYSSERRPTAQHLINLNKDISFLISGMIPEGYTTKGNDPNLVLDDVLEANAQPTQLGAISPGYRGPDVHVRKPGHSLPTRLYNITKNRGHFWVLFFAGSPKETSQGLEALAKYLQRADSFANTLNKEAFKFLTVITGIGLQPDEVLGVQKFGNAYYDVDHSAHSRYGVTPSCGAITVLRPDVAGFNATSTYGHSQLKTGHPVRSAIHKQLNGRLVLRWVTTWESLLLY